ncbi:MAG: nucleotidyltransferase family protein [Proteobacteria bacterium]|nr:nucleotidyltransferase family protein [Pseudomonadota bacterium]
MNARAPLADVDVVVLAGGLGTRLAGVLMDRPKLLAPIGDRPFLDHLVEWIASFGGKRMILCLGHLADKVTDHLAAKTYPSVAIECIVEPSPQGTAGALRLAKSHIQADLALVINGDSWLDADLGDFTQAHRKTAAPASILAVRVADAGRYGALEVSDGGRIVKFREKDAAAGAGLINGGVYALGAAFWPLLETNPGPSLERDVFQCLPSGTLAAYDAGNVPFIDIGTPESLAMAASIIKSGARA